MLIKLGNEIWYVSKRLFGTKLQFYTLWLKNKSTHLSNAMKLARFFLFIFIDDFPTNSLKFDF